MKPIPRYWASIRDVRTFPGTQEFDLTITGASDVSQADAERDARERLERLIAAGGPGQLRADNEYYPDRRLPEELLEEIHAADGTLIGAITRNRYGAAVLNTDAVLISDIDLAAAPGKRPRGGGSGSRPGLLGRLFRGGRSATEASGPDGTGVAAGEDPDLHGLAGFGKRGQEHEQILEMIDGFTSRHPELGVRTYRTRNGFRLLITGSGAEPGSERAQELLQELRSDRLYMLLCRVHDSYRARLTPKPWRITVDRFEHLGTRVATDPAHLEWVERYRTASQEVAVCRLLGVTGPAPTEDEQHIIDLHDRATRPESGLQLA